MISQDIRGLLPKIEDEIIGLGSRKYFDESEVKILGIVSG